MKEYFKSLLDRTYTFLVHHPYNKLLISQQAMEYMKHREEMKLKTPNNIALKGQKVYSQNDEDGIIQEIFKRIPNKRSFLEIGIQDGTECNTLALLLSGWKGAWIEGSDVHCQMIEKNLGGSSFPGRLKIINSFIDAENIAALVRDALTFLQEKELDFFSLDIDGNDYYITERLLQEKIRPKVFCVEYNGKFPPPLSVMIKYNPAQVWDRSEYQGASLQAFDTLFRQYGYTLLCCNLTGINAFFVENSYLPSFETYPIEDLFQPCRYHLSPIMLGAKPSLRFLKDQLQSQE
jgi:hypothetical protein